MDSRDKVEELRPHWNILKQERKKKDVKQRREKKPKKTQHPDLLQEETPIRPKRYTTESVPIFCRGE
jgi:hypothetical protein